jgi:glycosyltransferase involved in cell wall biosynthesis
MSRLVIVQFAGDYRETYRSLQSGGAETYYAQRHSVDAVAGLAVGGREVATICCTAAQPYDEMLAPGVRAIGVPAGARDADHAAVWQQVERCRPTHLVLRSPFRHLLWRARLRRIPVLLTIADSFSRDRLIDRARLALLVRLMNGPTVEAICNHGRRSAAALLELGADARRVSAWDWPHRLRPHDATAKTAPERRPWTLFFAGAIIESKGVGDVIRAVAALGRRGFEVQADLAGSGEVERFRALAASEGVTDRVRFLGRRPHSEVMERMRSSDVVLVPSRHEYPEGFPMTLFEALATRTPIVASDHPMFVHSMVDRRSAMVFAAGDADALAERILALRDEAGLYARLSQAAVDTWERLQVPVEWSELLRAWFLGPRSAFDALLDAGRRDLAAHRRAT